MAVLNPCRPRKPRSRRIVDVCRASRFGAFEFDAQTRLLCRDGREVALPPRVLGVLELLLRRAGDVVSRQELIDTVWKDAFVTDTSLAEAVSVLRQSLGDDSQSPTYIQTLHRRGYRFVAPVSTADVTPVRQAVTRDDAPVAERAISPSIGGQLLPWSAAIICAIIAGAAVWQATRDRQAASAPAARFAVTPPQGTSLIRRRRPWPFPLTALSSPGLVAIDTGCRLYLRPLDRLEPSVVAGTEDGALAVFFAGRPMDRLFRRRTTQEGGARWWRTGDAGGCAAVLGGAWIDREIIFAGSPSGGLMRVPADGGEARAMTTPREARRRGPARLAGDCPQPARAPLHDRHDGGRWRVRRTWGVAARCGIVRSAELADDHGRRGSRAGGSARHNRLCERRRARCDGVRSRPNGCRRTATHRRRAGRDRAGPGAVCGHLDGIAHLGRRAGADLAVALRASHGGRRQDVQSRGGRNQHSCAGPASRQTARGWPASSSRGPDSDVWVADVGRGTATRLTHSGINASPIWSADGRTIYFASRSDGVVQHVEPGHRRDSARHARCAPSTARGTRFRWPFHQTARCWRFSRPRQESAPTSGCCRLAADPPRAIVSGPFDDAGASFSPDSKWIAFQSADTGRWEICLQSLDDGRRIVVSTDGGERPFWTKRRTLFPVAWAVDAGG